MSLKHAKVVTAVDDPAAALKLRPSDWGSSFTDYGTTPTHIFSGGAVGNVLVRDGSVEGAGWTASPIFSDVTLTGGALVRQRPNDNSAQIVVQSTVPPEGRSHEAPFQWWQSGATFLSEWDPVMYLGYNADRALSGEPTMRWVIEGNYNTGTRNVEAYLEYADASSVGTGVWRPFFVFKNDKTTSVTGAGMTFQINAEQLIQAGNRAAPITFQMAPINANQPANLTVVGSGTGNNSNQYLVIAGGNTETNAAYVRLFGNTCTNAAGNKGVVQITGGVVAAPTVTTQGIIVLATGASGTERLRIQYDGLIGIGLPGTTLAALLQLGAGSTTVAPFKFTSGTNLTTAQAGAMEYDGTNLFFTRTGTTREGVLTQSAVTVEAAAQTRTVTVNIGGSTFKLLAA